MVVRVSHFSIIVFGSNIFFCVFFIFIFLYIFNYSLILFNNTAELKQNTKKQEHNDIIKTNIIIENEIC